MTPEEQKNNKKTAPKKINWIKAQRVATDVLLMATTAFISGLSMAAGQRLANQFAMASKSNEKTGLSLVRERTAI